MRFTRSNAILVAIAVVLALVVVLALTVQTTPDMTNSTSADGVVLTGFAPYNDSGANVAYDMGILESGINVGEVAVAAGTTSSAATPVLIEFSFMSNNSFNFEFDCVTFAISQSSVRPTVSSPTPTVENQPSVRWVENDTAAARVFTFCNAQSVNKDGWVEYNFNVNPNGTSTFLLAVSLQMTRGADHLNESSSVSLSGFVVP